MSQERIANHAGSWYSDDSDELAGQLTKWLGYADASHAPARAIIAPHAGYRYSGAVSAHAFKQVSPEHVKRVFILGPSHHARLGGCALSAMKTYATPIGNITIDSKINHELQATGEFATMTKSMDENEHSMELMLPYIAHVMRKQNFTLIPILVGSLSINKERLYGSLLSSYLKDPENLFVISSDFCHWGKRFGYRPEASGSDLPIHAHIKQLDHQGMGVIEAQDPQAFADYLAETQNTICGRHPIGVLLRTMEHLNQQFPQKMSLKFLKYAQSNLVTHPADSSVSYASASLVFH